uniref:Uncharacterized protein n=1 Tax=Eutreptiella gymnastica TaxID=73025 RepID=A0A7S1IYA1_9EUGL
MEVRHGFFGISCSPGQRKNHAVEGIRNFKANIPGPCLQSPTLLLPAPPLSILPNPHTPTRTPLNSRCCRCPLASSPPLCLGLGEGVAGAPANPCSPFPKLPVELPHNAGTFCLRHLPCWVPAPLSTHPRGLPNYWGRRSGPCKA